MGSSGRNRDHPKDNGADKRYGRKLVEAKESMECPLVVFDDFVYPIRQPAVNQRYVTIVMP